MSDVVDHFYFIGPCLSANGVAVAKYDPDHDLWQGVERRMWCRSLRIVSPARASAMIATDRIVRVNPWETHGIPPAVAVA